MAAIWIIFLYRQERFNDLDVTANASESSVGESVTILPTPVSAAGVDQFHGRDNSIMRLIPAMQVNADAGQPFNAYSKPFYLSGSPVTISSTSPFSTESKTDWSRKEATCCSTSS